MSDIDGEPKRYRVVKTSKTTWQIYKLLSTNPDGTLTYERQPKGGVEFWTDEKAAGAEAMRLSEAQG